MKTSKKITIFLIILAIVIASVIVARHFVGKHFQKKFSKYPPPGVIVEVVVNKNFKAQDLIEIISSIDKDLP